MYCSRRCREIPHPTDTCKLCGRCNWELHNQRQDSGKAEKAGLSAALDRIRKQPVKKS